MLLEVHGNKRLATDRSEVECIFILNAALQYFSICGCVRLLNVAVDRNFWRTQKCWRDAGILPVLKHDLYRSAIDNNPIYSSDGTSLYFLSRTLYFGSTVRF